MSLLVKKYTSLSTHYIINLMIYPHVEFTVEYDSEFCCNTLRGYRL